MKWIKSSFSTPSGNCVEFAQKLNGDISVRDSKDPHGPVLVFTRAEIDAFLKGAKSGEFDQFAE